MVLKTGEFQTLTLKRKLTTKKTQGAPGWLSRLSIRLQLRSWSQFVSSSPALGSVWTAQSLEPASDSVSSSLSAPPPLTLCLSLLQKEININKKLAFFFKPLKSTAMPFTSCQWPIEMLRNSRLFIANGLSFFLSFSTLGVCELFFPSSFSQRSRYRSLQQLIHSLQFLILFKFCALSISVVLSFSSGSFIPGRIKAAPSSHFLLVANAHCC